MRLRTQFILFTGLVLAATVAAILLVAIPGWQAELERGTRLRGQAEANMLARTCAEAAMVGNYSELQRTLDDLAASPDVVYAAVLDRQARVVVSNRGEDGVPFFVLDAPSPDPAGLLDPKRRDPASARVELRGQPIMDFIVPLTVYKRSWGLARLGLSLAPSLKAAGQVRQRMIWLGLAGLAVAVALVVLLAAGITRPLSRLARAAGQLSERQLETRVKPAGAREIRRLADSFNRMAESVQSHVQQIQQKSSELEAGYRVLARLGTTIDREALMSGVLEVIAEVLSAERCELVALDPRQGLLDRFAWGADGFATSSLSPAAFGLARFTEVDRIDELAAGHLAPGPDDLFVPLAVDERPMGGLLILPRDGRQFSDGERKLAAGISAHLLVALENARLYELAITDGLTGLTIRRYFSARLQEELDRARRYFQPFCLLMIDIDRFKQVNDTHGHPAGDQVLRSMAQRLRGCLRSTDLLSRWGGEELAVLLPGQGPGQGARVAEKLRLEVAERLFKLPEGPELSVTISIGVAAFPDHGDSAESPVEASDRALYQAKQTGRDRVCLATGAGEVDPVPVEDDRANDEEH